METDTRAVAALIIIFDNILNVWLFRRHWLLQRRFKEMALYSEAARLHFAETDAPALMDTARIRVITADDERDYQRRARLTTGDGS